MSSRRKIHTIATAFLVPFALAACGEDSTGVEGSGSVSAEIRDGSGSALRAASAARTFSGSASGEAQVWIWSEASGWVALDAPSSTTVTLQSEGASTVHSNARVDAGTYSRVRLVMDGFDADIAAGSTLGSLTLTGTVSIRVGGSDGRVEIEKEVTPFTVDANADAVVTFDLNSEVWMDREAAESQTADDAEIESATRAYAERR